MRYTTREAWNLGLIKTGVRVLTNGNGIHITKSSITGEIIYVTDSSFHIKRDDNIFGSGSGGTWKICPSDISWIEVETDIEATVIKKITNCLHIIKTGGESLLLKSKDSKNLKIGSLINVCGIKGKSGAIYGKIKSIEEKKC